MLSGGEECIRQELPVVHSHGLLMFLFRLASYKVTSTKESIYHYAVRSP
jgi:hypothetical protein